MKKLLAAMKLDIKNLYRSGIFFVYLVITILYIVIIDVLPVGVKEEIALYVILTDPTILGMFFIGSILMLEKEQGVIQYQVITPLSSMWILLSKALSLACIGVLSAGTIVVVTGIHIEWILFIICLVLISMSFSFLGAWVGVTCQTINQYFSKIIPVMLLVIIPCVGAFGFTGHKILLVFPGYLALDMMKAVFLGQITLTTYFEIIGMGIYCFIFLKMAKQSFLKRMVYQEQ